MGEAIDRIASDVGLSGAIRLDLSGRLVAQGAYGYANRAYGVANTVDTQFGTASGGKTLTALAVMSLIEDGLLSLDTTARSLLGGDLPLIDDRVTIEHLLSHRSGIGDYLDEDELDDNNDYVMTLPVHQLATTEQFLPMLDGHPMKFEPGTQFNYCNGSYIVLALLAERVSGVPYHDLIEQRVLEPAGLTDTAFFRSDELPASAALGYLFDDGLRTNLLHLPVRPNGDGGVYFTLADIHELWDAMLTGRIVSEETVAEMVRSRNPDAEPDPEEQYGLGVWLDDPAGTASMHGFDAGVGFMSVRDLDGRFTYTVISNQTRGAWPVSQRLGELAAEAR